MLRDNNAVYRSTVLDKPPPLAFRFSHWENESVPGASKRDHEDLSLVIFYYEFYALKGFFTCRILINSGERFVGSV